MQQVSAIVDRTVHERPVHVCIHLHLRVVNPTCAQLLQVPLSQNTTTMMCLLTHAGVSAGKATLVSQYRAALEDILEQPRPRPYRSAEVTETVTRLFDSDFFLGSHPELTPRYTQGVTVLHQTDNTAWSQLCQTDAALVTAQPSRQCTNSRHSGLQVYQQCPVPTSTQSDYVRHSPSQPIFSPDIYQHADQLRVMHVSSTCLDAASKQQPSTLACIHRPYR